MAAGQPTLCVKGKAGLGNRMLSAMTGLLYAELSGRVPLIDWSDDTYSNAGENAFPLLFRAEGVRTDLPDRDTPSVAPPVWQGQLDLSANELVEATDPADHKSMTAWRRYSIDLARLDHPEQIAVFWSYTQHIALLRPHFSGEYDAWRALSDDDIVGRLMRRHFVPVAEVTDAVAAFKAAHFGAETIGVHVRFMDRRTSLKDFLRRLDAVARTRPGATIFLATDNRDAAQTIASRYPNVVSTPKWFPESGISMHQNPECRDRQRNAIEALIDMYLLAECNHLIFPGSSTFSKLASLVSDMPREHVIDIERYSPRIRLKRLIKTLMQ